MGRLTDSSDAALWDGFNADMMELCGEEGYLYSLRPELGTDPLYDEPLEFVYEKYGVMFYVRQPDRDVEVTDRGKERVQVTQVWFSRAHLEDRGAPWPKEGDVVEFWGGQYDLEDVKDETQVATGVSGAFRRSEGADDGPLPLQFVMNAKRRERFLPERKTGGVLPVPEETL